MDKKPLRLIIVEPKVIEKKPLKLIIVKDDKDEVNIVTNDLKNIQISEYPSDHMCYILKSESKRFYVGYTVDFTRRLRQHNGEIVGGAKKTERGRPWEPICHIKGFYDKSSALRFEYRIQHSKKPRPNCISNISIILDNLIKSGDGVLEWPVNIIWL